MTIAQIKASTRVEEIVGRHVALHHRGTVYVGRCPFHDDRGRPNLIVFPATQTWCCFACGVQGDALDFVARIEGVSLRETMARLSGGVPEARRVGEPVTKGPVAAASPETRDAAYRALIANETLSPQNRAMLERRGFPAGYRVKHQLSGDPGWGMHLHVRLQISSELTEANLRNTP